MLFFLFTVFSTLIQTNNNHCIQGEIFPNNDTLQGEHNYGILNKKAEQTRLSNTINNENMIVIAK
jgi:hypothetical protein